MIAAVIILSCLSFLLLVCFLITLIIWSCEKDENYKNYNLKYPYMRSHRYNPPKIDYSKYSSYTKHSHEDSEKEDTSETVS